MNWYIGQEIVCILTHSRRMVVKDSTYIIYGLKQSCCGILIDVGVKSENGIWACGLCEKEYPADSIWWFNECLFAPLEYDQQAIDELLKIQEPQKL